MRVFYGAEILQGKYGAGATIVALRKLPILFASDDS